MDSYVTSNGSCFMVTWIVFKNHLSEVGLTQNLLEVGLIELISGENQPLRATSHTRLRACDHSTSSTLIGGTGGAGPSSLGLTWKH